MYHLIASTVVLFNICKLLGGVTFTSYNGHQQGLLYVQDMNYHLIPFPE